MIDGKVHVMSCALLKSEVFPTPDQADTYDEILACPHFTLLETPSNVYALAGELRQRCRAVEQRLDTPDAVHVAAGHLAGADEVWTTDRRLVNKHNAGLLTSTPVVYPHAHQIRIVFDE